MSHSRNQPDDTSSEALRPYLELSRMMREGRSWSGRERNCAFLNTGTGRFASVASVAGLDLADDARALATVDWDQDGDLDLWISNRNAPRLRFLRNELGRDAARFLQLRLHGDGRTTNADAVGARVEVTVTTAEGSNRRYAKTLRAGEGFLSQSSKVLHFGLGNAVSVRSVTVRWPSTASSTPQEFEGLDLNRRYDLSQGVSEPKAAAVRNQDLAIEPGVPELPSPSRSARIPAVTLLPFPRPTGREWTDASGPSPLRDGKPAWLVLWASWCSPCIGELKEITARAAELRAQGVEVLAVSVDGLGPKDKSTAAVARATLERLRFPFFSAHARPELVSLLQHAHDQLVPLHLPLPLPTSFLIDTQGHLEVLYKGRASVDQVLSDLDHSSEPRRERFRRSSPFSGSTIESPSTESAADVEEARIRFQYSLGLANAGRSRDAVTSYRELIALKPDFAEAHTNLALGWAALGDLDAALDASQEAARLRPQNAIIQYNLGVVLDKRQELEPALAAYRRALAIDPQYRGIHDVIGLTLAKLQRVNEAEQEFERARQADPDAAEPHNHLGLIALTRDNIDRAEELFRKATGLDPAFADAHNNLGVTLKRRGDLAGARRECHVAVELAPDRAEYHNNLGTVLLALGDALEARNAFQRALELDPSLVTARQNLERAKAALSKSAYR